MSGDQGDMMATGHPVNPARYAGEGSQPPFTPLYPFGGMPHHGRGRIIARWSGCGIRKRSSPSLACVHTLSEALMRLKRMGLSVAKGMRKISAS